MVLFNFLKIDVYSYICSTSRSHICVFGEPFKVEPEVPEHSAITRRQQFKVKSTLKEQKGKGKGQKQNKKKGKGKGKTGKGKKSRSDKKCKKQSMVSSKTMSSKRATLLKCQEKKRKEEEAQVPKKKKKAALAEAPKSEAPSSSDGPVKTLGKNGGRKSKAKAAATAKDKAERRTAPKAKASSTKKGQQTTKVSSQPQDIETLSGMFLEGKYLMSNLEVDTDNVCPVIQDMFKGILGRCEGSSCDGNPHSYESPSSNLVAFDMYWNRSAVGVKVRCDLIGTDGDVEKKPSKSSFKSIGYFSKPTCCISLQFAAAKIFAPHPNLVFKMYMAKFQSKYMIFSTTSIPKNVYIYLYRYIYKTSLQSQCLYIWILSVCFGG